MSYKFNPFTGNFDFAGEGSSTPNEEVFTFPTFASFPTVGESGKLYIDSSTSTMYYWDGSSYVQPATNYNPDVLEFIPLISFPAVGETNKLYVDTTTGTVYYWDGSKYINTKADGIVDSIESYKLLSETVNSDLVKDKLNNIYTKIEQNQISNTNSAEQDTNFEYFSINTTNGFIQTFLNGENVNGWSVTGNTVTITNNFASFNLNQTVVGSGLNLQDSLINAERWFISATGTVNFNPGANTFGFGVGMRSTSQVEKYSLLGRIGTANDAFLGRAIVSHNQNGFFNVNITDSGANTIPVSNGDTIRIEARLRDTTFTITAFNLTAGGQCTASYNFTLNTTPPVFLPNTGSPALWVFGGSFTFTDFTYGIEETSRPDLIILGDSKVRGYNAGSIENRWSSAIKSKNPRTVVFAGIADTINDLSAVVNSSSYFQNPDKRPLSVIVAAGSNDIRFSIPNAGSRYQSLVNSIEGYGIVVYPSLLHNETAINIAAFNSTLQSTYQDTLLLPAVPVVNTDGIHPDATSNHNISNAYIRHAPSLLKRRYFNNEIINKQTDFGTIPYVQIKDSTTKKEVFYAGQLPLNSAGDAYLLEPKTTYVLRGTIHLGNRHIIANDSNTITGIDKSQDGIIYTGTGAAIRANNVTLHVSNMMLSAPSGSVVDFSGRPIDSIQIKDCVFSKGQVGTINGGNIIDFNRNVCSVSVNGGLAIGGVGNTVSVTNNHFNNETSAYILNISGTFRTIKISDNDFRANNVGINVNAFTVLTEQRGGQISNNTFSGLATIENRIVGIDYDNSTWVLENNTGLVNTSDGYSPSVMRVLVDDFVVGGVETGEIGQYNWSFLNGSMGSVNISGLSRPGVIRRNSGSTAGQVCPFFMGRVQNAPNIAYGDLISCLWIIRLPSDLLTTAVKFGVSNDWGVLTPTHGVYFQKDAADTTWYAVSRNNSLQTRVDTTIPVVQNVYYKLEIVKQNGGIKYKIDGVVVATITSNIPDDADTVHFGNSITSSVADVRSLDIDYFSGIIKTTNR